MKKHVNIPIFIPHLGCPNMCLFCIQRTISGVNSFSPDDVRSIIDTALATVREGQEVEIAFFGGSFTGIDEELMIRLLEVAYSYVLCGKVQSIRCSTRPDYINEHVLGILKKYKVDVIELGLQSTDECVLEACKRGHGFIHEQNACRLITSHGFDLVGQMMIGLPSSTLESELETAEFIIKAGASGARIYPTVVFKDTELHKMSLNGKYAPISLEDAIKRSALVAEKFINANVDVIRIGLCSSDNLSADDTYYAGPNHCALGELVFGEVYYNLVRKELLKLKNAGSIVQIIIPKNALSKALGQRRKNHLRLTEEFGIKIEFLESDMLSDYQILVK